MRQRELLTEKQMKSQQKAIAALDQLGAEVVWHGTSGVDSVYFNRVQIADADLKCLKGLTGLTKLKLNHSPITDAGLKRLRSLTSLVQLHLADTKITDVGLGHLTSLKDLGFLDLSNTQVTNAGLESLNRGMHLSQPPPTCSVWEWKTILGRFWKWNVDSRRMPRVGNIWSCCDGPMVSFALVVVLGKLGA
jgi:hypothetical protein